MISYSRKVHELLFLTTCLFLFSCKIDISSSSEFDSYSEGNNTSCDESLTDDTSYHTRTAMLGCTGSDCGTTSDEGDENFPRRKGVNTMVTKTLQR